MSKKGTQRTREEAAPSGGTSPTPLLVWAWPGTPRPVRSYTERGSTICRSGAPGSRSRPPAETPVLSEQPRLAAEVMRAGRQGQRGKGAAPGEDILTPLEPSLGARREQPSQGLILQRRQSVKRQPVARSILPRCRGPGRPFSTTLWPISEAFPTRPRAHGNPRAGLSKPLKKHGSGSQWLRVWSHR